MTFIPTGIADTSAQSNAQPTAQSTTQTILVLGDSLSAGFGIDQSKSWVNLMEIRLKNEKYPYQVLNASISGETSRGGLNRLPALLDKKPVIVILELGANDGLRGLPLDRLYMNLENMILLSKKAGARVLLVGMKLPPNYGPAYTNGFQDIYKRLAEKHDVGLEPFILAGVATRRELMQTDNLHPTTEAQPQLLENIWPQLQPLLVRTSEKQHRN